MADLIICGGNKLFGKIDISGAKNAVLPIICASVGMNGSGVIYNCPDITDVRVSMDIIKALGGKTKLKDGIMSIDCNSINSVKIPEEYGCRMRSSITFCGGLLGRFGSVELSRPGGCCLGKRPIDIHLMGFKALGAKIFEEENRIIIKGSLKGADIFFPNPSVGATQNIMTAACFAKGTTVIYNPSLEPETMDLMNFLNVCGGKIKKDDNKIIIEEASGLRLKPYSVMSDRIEAGTFMFCAAMTGGKLSLEGISQKDLGVVYDIMLKTGCELKEASGGIIIKSVTRPKPIKRIITEPYPGFPTDLQPQLTAMLSVASGRSIIEETVFESRNRHIGELIKLGAIIKEDNCFIIDGVAKLIGSQVNCYDLRGGAALVIAALAAEGKSIVKNADYIFRGYENFIEKIKGVGGRIELI